MKKIRLIVSLIIMCLCFGYCDCFASTKVNTRTEQNYLVPSDVIVTESIRKDILSTPAVDASEKVYDFAELLTDKEEEKLYKQVKQFIKGTNIDFVIVTTNKHSKAGSKEYAHDFYNYNDFQNSGILFLIDMQGRGVYMVIQGHAYDLFPDSRMNPLLKNAYESVVKGKYYNACSNFLKSTAEFVNIGIADSDEVVSIDEDGSVSVGRDLHLLEVAIFAVIGTAIIITVMVLSNNMVHKATSSKDFLNKETMRIMNISEMYLGSHTSKKSVSDKSSSGSKVTKQGPKTGGTGRKF